MACVLGSCSPEHLPDEVNAAGFGADSVSFKSALDSAKNAVMQGDLALADALVHKVLELATTPALQRQRMLAYATGGLSFQHRQELDSAEVYYHKALDIATRNHATKDMAAALTNLGTVLEQRGDYSGSLAFQMKALALKEEAQDSANLARSMNNIGLLYLRKNDTTEAKTMFQRALAINEMLGDSASWSKSLANYAVVEMDLAQYDTALVLLRKAIAVRPRLSYGRSGAYLIGNMGLAYEGLGKSDSALWCYEKGLQQAIADKDPRTEAGIRTYLADLLIRQGELVEAAEHLGSGLAIARAITDPEDEKEALLSLAQLHATRKDFAKAYAFQLAYHALADSLMNADKDRVMSELRMEYEVDRKDRENAQLRSDQALAQLEARELRWLIAAALLLAILIGALAWLMLQRARDRARNRESELEQQALRLQMDPHFLFNALNTIPGLYASQDPLTATAYVGHLSNLLRLILETSRRLHVPLQQEIELIEHYLKVSTARHPDAFSYAINVDPSLDREALSIPPMLLQPLVENAILHGLIPRGTGGVLEVDISRNEGLLVCRVRDNGVGRSADGRSPNDTLGPSRGLAITAERIRLHNKGRGAVDGLRILDLRDPSGRPCGTEVEVRTMVNTAWS